MSVTLGGVTLDNDPIRKLFKSQKALNASQDRAVDGTEILIESGHGVHYPIVLESTTKTGWLKGSTVDSLYALAAVAEATYTLTYDAINYTVRFRNEIEPSCIQMEQHPDMEITTPDDDTYYIGKIYLMVVG